MTEEFIPEVALLRLMCTHNIMSCDRQSALKRLTRHLWMYVYNTYLFSSSISLLVILPSMQRSTYTVHTLVVSLSASHTHTHTWRTWGTVKQWPVVCHEYTMSVAPLNGSMLIQELHTLHSSYTCTAHRLYTQSPTVHISNW